MAPRRRTSIRSCARLPSRRQQRSSSRERHSFGIRRLSGSHSKSSHDLRCRTSPAVCSDPDAWQHDAGSVVVQKAAWPSLLLSIRHARLVVRSSRLPLSRACPAAVVVFSVDYNNGQAGAYGLNAAAGLFGAIAIGAGGAVPLGISRALPFASCASSSSRRQSLRRSCGSRASTSR